MSALLFAISAVVGIAGVGCAVAGAAMAAKRTRVALILIAMFLLMTGASAELRVWAERLEDPGRDAGKARAIAIESISIARGTHSPELRERALKAAEEALSLDAGRADPAGGVFLISEIVALVLIALGSVYLCLALVRPDLLTRRVARLVTQSAESQA